MKILVVPNRITTYFQKRNKLIHKFPQIYYFSLNICPIYWLQKYLMKRVQQTFKIATGTCFVKVIS